MAYQEAFSVRTSARKFTALTDQVAAVVARARVTTGVVHVFVRHTSCSLVITENADPAVHRDLETLAQRWAPDGDPAYAHNDEGDDDMAAHARAVLTSASVCIPLAEGRMLLGTWQGIFLWEHRAQAHRREIVVTVVA